MHTEMYAFIFFCGLLCSGGATMTAVPNSILIEALSTLMNEVFVKGGNNFVWVHYREEMQEKSFYFGDLVGALLRTLNATSYTLSYHVALGFKNFAHNNLILVDNLVSLRYLYARLCELGTRNLSRTIIFISDIRQPHGEDMRRTFAMLWQASVLNVNILMQVQEADLRLYTYYPFNAGGCQDLRSFENGHFVVALQSWSIDQLFPTKLKNFRGCTIQCATWEDVPHLTVHRTKDNALTLRGIEGSLLTFVSENLNFTIGLYMLNERELRESLNESGSIFKEIFAERADFALGGFYHRPDSSVDAAFSQSSYYFMSHIHLVTNVFTAFSPYEKLAYPLNTQVWSLLASVLLLGCLAIFVCKRLKPQCTELIGSIKIMSYYNMFVTALGGNSAVPLPRRNFPRLLLMVWLLSTMVLRGAYQSGMYQLLRDNRQRNPPQNIKSVLAQQYVIYMVPGNVRYLTSLPPVLPEQLRFLNNSELQSFPMLANATDRMAIITPYEYFGHFRLVNRLSQQLHLVRERIYSQQLCFYVRHNSYWLDLLDEQILHAQTYGFIQIWKRRNMLDSNIDVTGGLIGGRAVSDQLPDQLRNVLTMRELKAIFLILFWLHVTAIFIFFVELCKNKQQWLRK